MGRALVPGAFLSTVALAGSLIEKACSPQYRSTRLQAICEGRSKATVALLEESASWDADAVALSATEVEGGFKLNGKKLFVSDASISDLIIAVARAGSNLVLAFVDATLAGVSVNAMPGMDATRSLSAVEFNDVMVNADDVITDGAKARAALEHA